MNGSDWTSAVAGQGRRLPEVDRDGWGDVVSRAIDGELGASEIARLTERLASSGARLARRPRDTADLASTGGPTSLSTLLCPPMLVSAGWEVPKLGVPGRPAGGVDVLAGIDGYGVRLGVAEAGMVLDACGYVHVDAGGAFAPADASLFRYRQSVGAQAVPELAIASLLSKKLAMGVRRVGLEVRVAPHGNFGADLREARASASRFCEVARLLGLDPICILTDASRPFQPYVGRGEALLALRRLLDGEEDPWLADHLVDCATMANAVAGVREGSARRSNLAIPLLANVVAQGGSEGAVRRRAGEVERGLVHALTAPKDGFVEYDLALVRTAVVAAQAAASGKWGDAAGVMLLVRPGAAVVRGESVVLARCPASAWPGMSDALAASARIVHSAAAPRSGVLEMMGV